MRCIRNGQFLLVILVGAALYAWGQGEGQSARGTPPQQTGASGRGARGGAGGTGGTGDLYNYDATAGSGMPVQETQPETKQKITVNGTPLAYTTRTGFEGLRNATTGQLEAHLFFTVYTKDAVGDVSSRPLLFFFGGATGVAAGWQEFGGLGPKRIKWTRGSAAGWEENPDTLLAQADLVFVNPVGTAYSRPVPPSRGPFFWSTAGDISSLGEFVRGFVKTHGRQNAPLFIGGEDFGTGRVAGLALYLTEHQIQVRGIVLLSMTMSTDALAGDAQYITLLPSLVMTSWYHKRLGPDLQAMSAEQLAEQARQFAAREYMHALYKADRMTSEERARAVDGLSRLTGLSKLFVANNDLRISLDRFSAELMRSQHGALSYSDARVTGYLPAASGGGRGGFGGAVAVSPIDYNLNSLASGFLSSYEAYLQRELTFPAESSGIYYLMGGGVGAFTSTGNDDANLVGAFARNPSLRLFAALNYYDLNAPFYAAEFTLAHVNVSPEVRAHNIVVNHYEAGQMPYLDNKARARLCTDLARFINEAISPVR